MPLTRRRTRQSGATAATIDAAHQRADKAAVAASITAVEREVLRYLPTKMTFALLADKLGISRPPRKNVGWWSVVSPSWPHPPDCRCVCEVAGAMTARGVFWVAANWQAPISLTRRKATR